MISTLIQVEPHGQYIFEQITKSSVLFYAFEQTERSTFVLENYKILGVSYHKQKKEFHTQSNETLTYDALPVGAFGYDPLSMQFALIEAIQQAKTAHTLTVPVWRNNQLNNMEFNISEEGSGDLLLSHENNQRMTSFVLSPNYHYLPIAFEQRKNGYALFSGTLVQAEISPYLTKKAPFFKKNQ